MPEQLVVRALWEARGPVLPTFSCGEDMALTDVSKGRLLTLRLLQKHTM